MRPAGSDNAVRSSRPYTDCHYMCDHEECPVPTDDPLYQTYHDLEWGTPTRCDRTIFEKVCLEGFQSGLSWRTILHRRPAFRRAFADFQLEQVARFTEEDINRLLGDASIIRNRRKINSAINNAKRALELQQEAGSLASFFWHFEPDTASRPKSITRAWLNTHTTTPESTALAKALKIRGWTFVGPTTLYALMQALGLVNDHVAHCPARASVEQKRQDFIRPPVFHPTTTGKR